MNWNTLFVGWNRAVTGREKASLEHFQEFVSYLGAQTSKGTITNFEPVLLQPHGGDLNGFVVVKGDPQKLAALEQTEEWQQHILRAHVNMNGIGVTHACTGDAIQHQIKIVQKYV